MTVRLFKTRDPHGKLHIWSVDDTLQPVPDESRALTHQWFAKHADDAAVRRVAVKLYGDEWSYKCGSTGAWTTDERPDFDRLPEAGR